MLFDSGVDFAWLASEGPVGKIAAAFAGVDVVARVHLLDENNARTREASADPDRHSPPTTHHPHLFLVI